MESIKKEKKRENMWHWNQPENGLSIEDCERIAEESRLSPSIIYRNLVSRCCSVEAYPENTYLCTRN